MHSAPWTKTSVSMGTVRVMAAISLRLISRASTTREKPSSLACQAPEILWTVSWVEACSGISGAALRTSAATPRSCTISASMPYLQAISSVRSTASYSRS